MTRFLLIGCLIGCLGFILLENEPHPEHRLVTNKTTRHFDEPIDFNRDIRPVLATHCLACHGPDDQSREAGLRLDRFDEATKEADSGEIPIVPGSPESSEILRRIVLEKGDSEKMPPTGNGLNEKEIAKIRKWIKQGAKFDEHWAFVAPTKPKLPAVSGSDWIRRPLDRFVLKQIEENRLAPSPAADRYILARRVYLDLIGVPPTIEQADEFVNDDSPDAYEKMVDRVLGSPKFGERWAGIWLDLARYADSQGYAQDSPRRIFRYRDWVIGAINKNIPFDQFTIEQIAGDLLDNPDNDQILATAFHRNTMTNSEGGTDDEEFRTAAVVDRVNSTMQIWMGMTMGCAQCHTHKYDPISQEEYFQVLALLNQTEDADRGNEAPLHSEFSQSRIRRQESIRTQIAELEKKIKSQSPKQTKLELPSGRLKTRYVRVQGLGKMFLHLAEVQVFSGGVNHAVKGKARQSTTAFGGPAKLGNDGNTDGDFQKKSVTHTNDEMNPWWEVDLGKSVDVSKVVVWNRNDSEGVRVRLKKFRVILLDEKRRPLWTVSTSKNPNPSSEFATPSDSSQLTKKQKQQLAALWNEMDGGGLSAEQKQLASLKAKLKNEEKPDITTPIMKELPDGKRRKTFVHVRGNFRSPGKEVSPGTPSVFHPLTTRGKQPDRLDFARWLVSENNPVTARVVVNRFWENLFGNGIVETSEDFGTQGELPSNSELLDYLAIEFVEHEWDVKWLLKTIVTSATYRQTSRTNRRAKEMDPNNRLLARGPKVRLGAEMIRDQALFVAGTLSTKMNGPSVRPPRPKLGLRAAFGGTTDWDASPGEDAYRRGLYTTWRRTSPYPSMATFDAPSREFCTIRRNRTNTPLQALVTLNDPVYVEAARQLAWQVVDVSDDEKERMAFLFRRVLVRPARTNEIAFLSSILKKIRSEIAEADAKKLAGSMRTDEIQPREFASWIVLSNVLLNLDETLARP